MTKNVFFFWNGSEYCSSFDTRQYIHDNGTNKKEFNHYLFMHTVYFLIPLQKKKTSTFSSKKKKEGGTIYLYQCNLMFNRQIHIYIYIYIYINQ
jgi:hypothetical protein